MTERKERQTILQKEASYTMSVLNVRIKHNIATYDIQLPVEANIGQLSDKVTIMIPNTDLSLVITDHVT